MVLYRRNRVAGGTCFFTPALAHRRATLLTTHIDLLRESWRVVRHRWSFETVAVVVLPEHLHALWRLPGGDDDYPGRWRAIKAQFTHRLGRRGVSKPRRQNGAYRLWQPRYWEHTIRDGVDLQQHVDDIHYNPVKHALAQRVADWPYSSFHRDVGLMGSAGAARHRTTGVLSGSHPAPIPTLPGGQGLPLA